MNFTFDKPRVQYFSLPSNVIYRLWKHPRSSVGALKLYQTCKYFYYKQNAAFFNEIFYNNGYRNGFLKLKFKKNVLLISLRNALTISRTFPPFLDANAKMLRYHNITCLSLYWITLKFEEFKILTSITTIRNFTLSDSEMCYSDNTPVTIDVVLAGLPNLEYFKYENFKDDYNHKALENLNKLTLWNKLRSIHLRFIHELADTFDPKLLCRFIANNIHSRGDINVNAFFRDETKGKALAEELRKMSEKWIEENDDMQPSLGICGPYCKFY